MRKKIFIAISIIAFGRANNVLAQEEPKADAAELAKELSNPIASLISVPFQNNMDIGIGDNLGSRNTLNIQPVYPLSITANIKLITRVILPVISQHNISGTGNSETGLGDAFVSFFLSPSVSKGGFTWGAGPVLLVPTATNDLLASKKFGLGPTAVALYQSRGMTIGALWNQIWSVAGDDTRPDLSMMLIQPFFVYNGKSGAGIGGTVEWSQNWITSTSNVWFTPYVSGITSMGKQKVQFLVGPRFNLAAADGAKAKFGVRAQLVFLFPK